MNEVRRAITINGHDVLVFLAGSDRFCNVTQLGAAFGRPDRTFERFLSSGQGAAFVNDLATLAGVPADRLYFHRPGEGFWANHDLALEYAGWVSHDLKMLYFRAVREWAAEKQGEIEVAEYADDPIVVQMDSIRQMSTAIQSQRIHQLKLELQVKDQGQRLEVVAEQAAAAERRADVAVDTITGYHGFFALALWAAKEAGIFLGPDEARDEATTVLRPLCARRNIPPKKVPSAMYRHINAYHESVLRVWADDYLRRHNRMKEKKEN